MPAFCAALRPDWVDALVVLDALALDVIDVTGDADVDTGKEVGVGVGAIVVVAADDPQNSNPSAPDRPQTAKNGLVKFGACQLPSPYRGSSSNTQPDSR